MAVIKKELIRALAVRSSGAQWITHGGKWDSVLKERVGGHKTFIKPNVIIETQSDWLSLSVREAEKLVKVLRKSIKKAKASSDKAAEGAK